MWLDHHQTSGEAAPLAMVASMTASLAALDLQQTSGEAAPSVKVASVTASLAAQDPQLAPDGAALMTSHWLAGGTWCFRQNSYV